MKAILIPVKEFCEAKKRLAPHLPPADRAALAEAMCEDFFRVVAATRCADRVFVISKEFGALSRARKLGWDTIAESYQTSESDSVDAGSRYCAEQGVHALLRLPIDLPLAEPRDIEAVFEQLDLAPSVVMVPSNDGTGTNALLRSPPIVSPVTWPRRREAAHVLEFFETLVWNSISMSWMICGGFRIDCGRAPLQRGGSSSAISVLARREPIESVAPQNFPVCRIVLRNRGHHSALSPRQRRCRWRLEGQILR